MWLHVAILLFPHTRVWRVLHEQQLHPYQLQKVHALGPADFQQLHCVQRTTGSPRGTTLVVQSLEMCYTNSETQDTRYQPIVFRSSNLFYIEMVRFRTWVPCQNFIYYVPLYKPLEICKSHFETPCIYIYSE